ncbi:MAG: tRNA lysidine(34) synthetase TilS [Flavitalea sp.]
MLNEIHFNEHVRTNQLFATNELLLVAVSGGVDSVSLCELLAQSGYLFEIAHVNFQLREKESQADEMLVRDIAEKYRVPIHVKIADTRGYADNNKISIQVAARQLRYQWFDELLTGERNWLLTAHHEGDNIETMLMNFFRGTGIKGLHGILPKQNKIIRPLLPFTKEDILAFANRHQLKWREDESNSSDKYTRNYFRNTIIPMVAKVYPEVEKNLAENISRFNEVEQLYNRAIYFHKKNLIEQKGKEAHIPVLKLKQTKPLGTVLYEIIKNYRFTSSQVNDVIRLLDAGQSKFVQSTTHRIIRNRKWLIIADKNSADSGHILIAEGDVHLKYPGGSIELKTLPAKDIKIDADSSFAYTDSRELSFPLILRKYKAGDYFYPLGMHKKKKISRYLTDRKLSATQKENVWVLESGQRICWIVGLRIDDRFRVKENTTNVLRIRHT